MNIDLHNLDFSNLSVLLVDDDPAFRKLLSSILQKNFKTKTLEAANPQEAFEVINENMPDLLILDMEMPVMDGLTALKFLRSKEETINLPVIACTALSYGDLFISLAKLKISDYIVKPSSGTIIKGKLHKALNKISKSKK